MSRYDLLPPNATQLERDFSRAISPLPALGPLVEWPILTEDGDLVAAESGRLMLRESSVPFKKPGGVVPIIRTAKRVNVPDSVVPWLIYEYGLGEILPYLGNDQRRALAEGVLWQRIRGTPDSVRIALGWIGVTGLIEETECGTNRWAEYQLGLAAATSGEAVIDQVMAIARISSPVRSRLQRIYAVYDFRRAVYDQCSWDDGSIYDDHSGVRPRPDWPQISYGQITAAGVSADSTVASGLTSIISVLVLLSELFCYDQNQWDEGWHTLNNTGSITETIGYSCRYQGQSWGPFTWGPRVFATDEVVMGREDGFAVLREDAVSAVSLTPFQPLVVGREDGDLVSREDGNVLAHESYGLPWIFAREDGPAMLREDGSPMAQEQYPVLVGTVWTGTGIAQEEYPPAYEGWADVNVVVSGAVQSGTFDSVFCRESGGAILSEDNRVIAREEYLT
jgi:P2-related tail formation protein